MNSITNLKRSNAAAKVTVTAGQNIKNLQKPDLIKTVLTKRTIVGENRLDRVYGNVEKLVWKRNITCTLLKWSWHTCGLNSRVDSQHPAPYFLSYNTYIVKWGKNTRGYLFWEVKVSLWGSRPLYSTLIRSCWLSAPSVRAMEPRLEGYNTHNNILNHIKDKHMNAYDLSTVMVNRKINQVSVETATAYWATPSLTSSVKFISVLSVCRFYPQSLSQHIFPDITHTAIRNETSKEISCFQIFTESSHTFFFPLSSHFNI